MNLKSKIRIIYFVCFCLALAIVLVFITAKQQVDRYTLERQYSFEIVEEGNRLHELIFEHVMSEESLVEIPDVIDGKYRRIMNLLQRFAPHEGKYQQILYSIGAENERLHELFAEMIEHSPMENTEGVKPENVLDIRSTILKEMITASHTMIAMSFRLQDSAMERVRNIYVRSYIMILVCVGMIVFFIGVILTLVKRTFAGPIMQLTKSMEIVGAGNLDYRIASTTEDEFGRLSRAFDDMTERLKTVTVSHEELERSIVRRTSALTATNRKLMEQVAERKQAEKALRESEERYRDLFENASDLIQSVSPDGRFLYVNRSWCETLGYGKEDLLKISLFDVIHPDSHDHCEEAFMKASKGENIKKVEVTFRTKDGREILLEGSVSCKIADGVPVATRGIFRDITERKMLENQLRQAQKMEAVGRLAGGIAHDFNNLLTAIMGYSELILAQKKPGKSLEKGIKEIRKAADRASSLVNRLLAFSRRQTLESQVLDLNTLIRDMNPLFGRLIRENILLETDLRQDIGCIKGDRSQLEQVILNLVINAQDAMPSGGTLTIRTGSAVMDKEFINKNPGSREGSYSTLQVEDTGCGIDKKTQAKLFEPFFTTKELGRGTGLGLSIVYGIVKQSDGYITVSSSVSEGTKITIYLPRYEGRPKSQTPEADTESGDYKGTETVLVVEDEEGVRSISREALIMSGYTVLNAANAEEALELCKDHGSEISLVVTDVVMPGMNGLELFDRIVGEYPAIKVLFMSGYTYDIIGRHGILDPGMPFLHKPFKVIELLRKVRTILDGSHEE